MLFLHLCPSPFLVLSRNQANLELEMYCLSILSAGVLASHHRALTAFMVSIKLVIEYTLPQK